MTEHEQDAEIKRLKDRIRYLEWLENKKAELRAINGLDPVEELLTQAGIRQHSHQLLVETNQKLLNRIEYLESELHKYAPEGVWLHRAQ